MRFSQDIPRDTAAPAAARVAIRELEGRLDASDVAEVGLLVSELVTNSVKYGAGPIVRLIVDATDARRVLVSVVDDGRAFVPQRRARPATEAGGWGLHLVDHLSDSWGAEEQVGGVWFEVAASAPYDVAA